MDSNRFQKDIVCQVLADPKSLELIQAVRKKFLPDFIPLDSNYCGLPHDPYHDFGSEHAMLEWYSMEPNVRQTFYWNGEVKTRDNIMVGANITSDNQLVFSLTVDGTEETEARINLELKSFLNSKVGVVTYIDPADYDDGEDFARRYGHIRYPYE